jgi:hypothetical protein
MRLWHGRVPDGDRAALVRDLYAAENEGQVDPSGSQDMVGILYPGINRLDYDFNHQGGVFPYHVESNNELAVSAWLEQMIYMVPIDQRPLGYYPLDVKNLEPSLICRLGQAGADCFDAIIAKDPQALGNSMGESMHCSEAILPNTVRHSTITIDLIAILTYYQNRYYGAMYSGCGGGYIYVVSDEPVPGGFQVQVKISR